MSEYYTTDTLLDDPECLRQALRDIGVPFEEKVEPKVHWHGRPSPGRCDFVVRRADLGDRAYNDMGWRWNPETRGFDLVVDNLDHAHNQQVQGIIRQVVQHHNARKAVKVARRMGYVVHSHAVRGTGGIIARTASGHVQVRLSKIPRQAGPWPRTAGRR